MTSAMADSTTDKSGPAGKPIGGKAAAPGGPKPASGVTKPPAAPPKGGPAAGAKPAAAPAGRAAGSAKEGGDFKVIRSAPAPEGGSSAPLLIGGAVIALAIGGYFVINRKPSGNTPPPVTNTDGTTSTTEPEGPEMPDAIWDIFLERQNFLEGEGRVSEALKEALEKEKEYATSRRLRVRLAELRAKVSAPGATSEAAVETPDALMSQAEASMARGNPADAVSKLDEVLAREGLPEPVAGKAYFLRAVANLRAGDLLAAGNDVDGAASMNFDPKKCDELREQIAASQPR